MIVRLGFQAIRDTRNTAHRCNCGKRVAMVAGMNKLRRDLLERVHTELRLFLFPLGFGVVSPSAQRAQQVDATAELATQQ